MQNGSVSDFGYTNNAIGNRTAMSRAGSAFSTPDTISYSTTAAAKLSVQFPIRTVPIIMLTALIPSVTG